MPPCFITINIAFNIVLLTKQSYFLTFLFQMGKNDILRKVQKYDATHRSVNVGYYNYCCNLEENSQEIFQESYCKTSYLWRHEWGRSRHVIYLRVVWRFINFPDMEWISIFNLQVNYNNVLSSENVYFFPAKEKRR